MSTTGMKRPPPHTGDRIEFRGWTMSYLRDEYADHGRRVIHRGPRDDVAGSS